MISVMTAQSPQQEAAGSWKVLQTVVFVAGISGALFAAGTNYGGVKDTARKVEVLEARTERTYVRKDGRELADIQAQLRALNDKMDYMIRQRVK